MTVVQDDAAELVAWLAPGTPLLRPVLPDGRELRSVPAVEIFRASVQCAATDGKAWAC